MTIEEFRHELQDLLTHIHDPDFQPGDRVYAPLDCDNSQGVAALQLALVQTLETLCAIGEGQPAGPTIAELHVLHQRYVARLTQEESARQLNMSVRTLQRVQRRAVFMLARYLWDGPISARFVQIPGSSVQPTGPRAETGADWRVQIQEELAALRQRSPHGVADLALTLARVFKIGETIASQHTMQLHAEPCASDMMAAIHPSALRQALIMLIDQVGQVMAERTPTHRADGLSRGTITLHAQVQAEQAVIVVTGDSIDEATGETPGATTADVAGEPTVAIQAMQKPPQVQLLRELVESYGGTLTVEIRDQTIRSVLALPAIDRKMVVFVVDDNADLVSFYQRFVVGAPYEIVHLSDGNHLFEMIDARRPDIIILDLLLPDMDGWELLTYLHENPVTRSIPTIVSSVVGDEQLAFALGAVAYLPKPVRRWQFIQALDQVLETDQRSVSRSAGLNAAVG